jgi:hypothetical protein
MPQCSSAENIVNVVQTGFNAATGKYTKVHRTRLLGDDLLLAVDWDFCSGITS